MTLPTRTSSPSGGSSSSVQPHASSNQLRRRAGVPAGQAQDRGPASRVSNGRSPLRNGALPTTPLSSGKAESTSWSRALAAVAGLFSVDLKPSSKVDPTNPHHAMPSDLAARREIVDMSKLADYVYKRNPQHLPANWVTSNALAIALSSKANLPAARDPERDGILSTMSPEALEGRRCRSRRQMARSPILPAD